MSAKAIVVKPIQSKAANAFIKAHHYSGKVVPNSALHFGAFLRDRLHGVMSLGPPIVKKAMLNTVRGTGMGYLELNRMAFDDVLPRNSESRALGYVMRTLRKQYPHLKWIVSFADACKCGDGTIYRASGFKLIAVKRNTTVKVHPDTGEHITLTSAFHKGMASQSGGWQSVPGFMLKYIYFLDPAWEDRLAVPVLPFSAIAKAGAGMYRGEQVTRPKHAMVATSDTAAVQRRPGRSNIAAVN